MPGTGIKSLAIGIIFQQERSLFGDPLAQPMQAQMLFEHQAEHCHRGTIERHWHADRLFGGSVNLCEQRPLAYVTADQVPGSHLELFFAQSGNRGRRPKAGQQLDQTRGTLR
jgi:hypothetical protein